MPPRSFEALTGRESDVFEALRRGLSNKAIARSLGLSEPTVKFHLKNLYSKIGASGRVQALLIAQHQGGPIADRDQPSLETIRRQMEPALTPLSLLQRASRLYGEREAAVDDGRRFTYTQFLERCQRGAAGLAALGLSPGDRVATIAVNSHSHLEQFFAVPMAGGVIVPINYRLSADEIAGLIQHSGARFVIATREFLPILDRIRPGLAGVAHFISLDGPWSGWHDHSALLARKPPGSESAPLGENDLLAINYTSGTISAPRGVMVSHRNAWMNTIGCLLHWPLAPSDRFLWTLPLSHGNGWGFVWTVTAAGATHVCDRSGDTESLLHQIVDERVTALCAGRSALLALASLTDEAAARLPKAVRVLTAGGAPGIATLERVESRLGWSVSHAYGLTETAVFVAFRGPPADGKTLDTAQARARWNVVQGGDLFTSGEVRVVDEEGVDVPRDGFTLGEVVTRGPSLMLGYYKDPEATRRALMGGWFHTGDAGVVHADGSLEVRDRIKDIIISDDQLLAPADIENVLMEHAAVQEAAVVGREDRLLGEAIHAYVVLRADQTTTSDDLIQWAAGRLAPFKRPHRLHIVADLPRTGSGKVMKRRLREIDVDAYPSG